MSLEVEFFELDHNILAFLIELGEGLVVHVYPWEWVRTSPHVSVEDIGHIHDFLISFKGDLGVFLLLGLHLLVNRGCFESSGRVHKLTDLLGLFNGLPFSSKNISLFSKVIGGLWLEGDGDEVFGRDE
jgi:hypothetical protein